MKTAKTFAAAFVLLGMIAVALVRGNAAGTNNDGIFVANGSDVTAYPIGSKGNVPPIALMTDMAAAVAIARDASGRIYVANRGSNTVTVYSANANGNVPPLAVIGGSNTGLDLPADIALDASGKIFVLNGAANSPGIKVYPPLGTSTGVLNEAPIASIAGSNTLLAEPDAIALDSQGNIYVANQFGSSRGSRKVFDYGSLTVYPAGSNGNIAPRATIGGDKTGLTVPRGIAVDSAGNIYVVNFVVAQVAPRILKDLASITVYSAGSKGNAPPIATIGGDNTGLSAPLGIALDSSRNLYVANYSNVKIFVAESNGNVSPAATITGADTSLSFSEALALDSDRNIYVLNSDSGPSGVSSVTVYPAGSSGDTVPATTITSNFTMIVGADGVALDSTGKIYVLNANGGPRAGSGIAVYSAGSYATGGPPVSTIAGDNTGLELPLGIALDSSDNIFVLNGSSVTVYPAGSVGNLTPTATIYVDSAGKSTPTGIAVGLGGNLYVTSVPVMKCRGQSCRYTGAASIAVYPAGSNGYVNPSAFISGSYTMLATPLAVAVDRSGNIYVANEGPLRCAHHVCGPSSPGSINVYAPASNGDVKPIATIKGADTGLVFPYAITLDSNGNIYVLNVNSVFYGCPACDEHSIRIFAAGSDGNAAPMGTIAGPSTGLNHPRGLAIGPASP